MSDPGAVELAAERASGGAAGLTQSFLLGVLDAVPSGLCAVDADGRVLLFNRKAEEISGRPRADVLALPFEAVFGAWSPSRGAPALLRTLTTGRAVESCEERVRTSDGRDVTLSVRTEPLLSGDEVTGGVVVFAEAGSVPFELGNDFVSLIGHEVRSPAAAAKGYVDMVLGGEAGELTPVQRDFLEVVSRSTSRLLDITSTLLDICRIESGRTKIHRDRAYLGDVLDTASAEFRIAIEGRELAFERRSPEHLPYVHVDRRRIESVVGELLANAARFTPDGGGVTLCAEEEGEAVRISVEDTGPGLADDMVGHAFEKFTHGGEPAVPDDRGNGLGLAMAQAVVAAHGGEITVSSPPSGGTVAAFSIPLGDQGDPSFLTHLKDALSVGESKGRSVGLVVVRLADAPDLRAAVGEEAVSRLLGRLQEALAGSVRGADIVSGTGEGVLAALPSAAGSDLSAALGRIREKVAGVDLSLGSGSRRARLEIGSAVCPDHGERAEDLLRYAESHTEPLEAG